MAMRMRPTSTMIELLPLAGLTNGHVRPHYPSRSVTQRLLPALETGDLQSVLLTGEPGGGKTTLATELARLLEPKGFFVLALAATAFQPLSPGRVLVAFETAFLRHKLLEPWKIVCNAHISVEDRLGVVAAVMNRDFACVLVLDGLESCLDPKTGHFLDPVMGAFFTYLLDQLRGLSRVLMTSQIPPVVNAPAPLPATCRHEILPPHTMPAMTDVSPDFRAQARVAALQSLDDATLDSIMPMAVFNYPVPVAGYCAVTNNTHEHTVHLLHRLEKSCLASGYQVSGVETPGVETIWHLHPLLSTAANQVARDYPEKQKAIHTEAGKYLIHVAQKNQRGSANHEIRDQINSDSLGLSWQDLSLEAIGHFLHSGAFSEALESARPVSDYFTQRGFFWEQERLNRKLLALREHPRPLYLVAMALLKRDSQEEAQQLLERVLNFDASLFPKEVALALFDLATLLMQQQPAEAREKLERSLSINQRAGDRSGQAVCLAHLGFLGLQQDDAPVAQKHLQAALALCRALQDKTGIANLLPWTGELLWRVGNIVQARSHFQEALSLIHGTDNAEVEAQLHHRLAIIDLGEENFAQALAGFSRALDIRRSMKNQKDEAFIFFQLGRLAKAMGNQEASLRFLGLCQRINQSVGDPGAEQELALFFEIATTAMGLDRITAQTILDDVWEEYGKDMGQGLMANAFQK